MPNDGTPQEIRLGFLTSIRTSSQGFAGGLLVTNRFGRPLEFQCTTPITPNRTQQILYGPTMVPYVLSELIGRTLFEKSGVQPQLILTDQEEILALRSHVSIPVVCVCGNDEDMRSPSAEHSEQAAIGAQDTTAAASASSETSTHVGDEQTMRLGRQRLRFDGAHPSDRESLDRMATVIPAQADLQEPFERIHQALKEACQPQGTA